ncbi:MAG: adenosylhomocysteinase [Candidatus Jacksonbacteria bacterium]
MKYHIKNLQLYPEGQKRIKWAEREMPVLRLIRERFANQKPLKNAKISACLHVTTETANLMIALKAGGADLVLCASNPLSTQDDVAASLVKHHQIPVFAIHGENRATYYRHIKAAIAHKPQITMDDGADVVSELHRQKDAPTVWGSTEETTTGVIRLKALADQGKLRFPVIAVNDAKTKHLFDNRYGTGQSAIDGITRATNILWAGRIVVICGYGWCGRGIAARARGMSAQVIIIETDPIRALEAKMDGFQVMDMMLAAKIGQVFITATGNISIIRKEHFANMPDGAILSNAGHFNVEIDLDDLGGLASTVKNVKPNIQEYKLKNNRRIYVLGQGRLVNLACAEGHPAQVMDMSFAGQALAAEFLAQNYNQLDKKVYALPDKLDQGIAQLKLKSMGIKIEKPTAKQQKYLASWEAGT